MLVLVIDGFGESPESRKRFQTFYNAVIKAFNLCWPYGKTVQVRRYDDIGDYLNENKDGFVQVDAIRQFDKVDFFFVDGDLQLRPWTQRADKVFRLMQMCAQTGKCLFASSAFAGIVLCAINTKGRFERIASLHSSYPEGGEVKSLDRLVPSRDAMFLDAWTGDMYQFDFDVEGWRRAFNCGVRKRRLHSNARRQLGRFSTAYQRIVPPDQHQGQPGEVEVTVMKLYVNHWVFDKVDSQSPFLLQLASTKWTLSEPTNSVKVSVLAEGPEGAVMFESGHFLCMETAMWACDKYPVLQTMMNNFVRVKSALMQKLERVDYCSQLVLKVGEGSARDIMSRTVRPRSAIQLSIKQKSASNTQREGGSNQEHRDDGESDASMPSARRPLTAGPHRLHPSTSDSKLKLSARTTSSRSSSSFVSKTFTTTSVYKRPASASFSGTMTGRVMKRLEEAVPSHDTTLLIAGLVSGSTFGKHSIMKLTRKISANSSAADIPSAKQANEIVNDVERACGGGSIGRQERSNVATTLKEILDAQVKDAVRAQLDAQQDSDSDSEVEMEFNPASRRVSFADIKAPAKHHVRPFSAPVWKRSN